MIFLLKLLCKKHIYNINHCVDVAKKIEFFFHAEHCIASVSNSMLHLTYCACLMHAIYLGPQVTRTCAKMIFFICKIIILADIKAPSQLGFQNKIK